MPHTAADAPSTVRGRSRRLDPWWLLIPLPLALALIGYVVVSIWGHVVSSDDGYFKMGSALPLSGHLDPTFYRSLVLPVIVAVLLVAVLPWLAVRLPWRVLLPASVVGSGGWAVSLAAVHGTTGLTHTIGTGPEYLSQMDLARSLGVHRLLSEYTDHLLFFSSEGYRWHTHASGHPPGAVLSYYVLDRLGLGGVGWAAGVDIAAGASAAAAALITIRLVTTEDTARRAAPFIGCAPAVLWIATSADAYFMGVTAWGIALLAVAGSRAGWKSVAAALAGGLMLGWALHLSYGLTLIGPVALVVLLRRRRILPLVVAAIGVAIVFAAFIASGFWWLDGLMTTHQRYYQGVAQARPYHYFFVADLLVLALVLGPAGFSGLFRIGRDPRTLLPVAALAGVLIADVSGLAAGEVERIWLPWTPWLLSATALIPGDARRSWLAAQLLTAVAVVVIYTPNW